MIPTPALPHTRELRGEFGGFVRTLLGKRRLLLHQHGEELLLKVPKELRHLLQTRLQIGQAISVHGSEEIEKRSGDVLFVVSKVQLEGVAGGITAPSSCIVCPIRVCAKKNCWRSGGKELHAAFQGALGRRGLSEMVEVHPVECLDHCKSAPNAEWNGQMYRHCAPKNAEWIVEQIARELSV